MRLEEKATVVSSIVAFTLMLIKMVVGILSGSIAILASAIDSFLDLAVSSFNLFALHNATKEADDTFNFGRKKIEPIAAAVEGTIISLSALFIFYQSFQKLIYPRDIQMMDLSILVMFISIVLTLLLVIFLQYIAKKTDNLVIKADALHYKTDLFSNAAVLIAIGTISLTNLQIIDAIAGFFIAFYMIFSAYPIMKSSILYLMDVALPAEDVKKIRKIIQNEPDITAFHMLRTAMRSDNDIFITVHCVFNISISLFDAHQVSDRIERKIKALFEQKHVTINIHLDPYDDTDENLRGEEDD